MSGPVRIVIDERTADAEYMAGLLEYIAQQLRDGMTSGFGPRWYLEEAEPA